MYWSKNVLSKLVHSFPYDNDKQTKSLSKLDQIKILRSHHFGEKQTEIKMSFTVHTYLSSLEQVKVIRSMHTIICLGGDFLATYY